MNEHRKCEKEIHYVMLDSMKEYKMRQKQQDKKEKDEVYRQMSRNLENVREVARNAFSRASTISVEEHRMALSETDFLNIKEKMNKIDQRIDDLYQNWQAESKEAITSEQCEDIQKFYEPHVRKYETKYKVLYQMLRQTIDEWNRVPLSRVSATELTPSLVALKDASTLKRKEWNRGEPNIETPHMYSTIKGKLTPTAPVYEDMRTATPLHVTPEKSLEGFSVAVEGTDSGRATQQSTNNAEGLVTNIVPPISIETRPKVISERISQEELPRRSEIMRETSREDALAATRLFFNTVAERRNTTEVPTTSTMSVSQTETPPVTSVPVETERTELETSNVGTLLPNGSPPRPTATDTCRPRMWVQQISEGQIEE